MILNTVDVSQKLGVLNSFLPEINEHLCYGWKENQTNQQKQASHQNEQQRK